MNPTENHPMMYKYFPNIIQELPQIPSDSIISRTIHSDEHVNITLFGFAPGQELSEHTSTMPAILEVIKGSATITLGTETHTAEAGSLIYIPARLEHSLIAETEIAMLLYLLK